MDSSEPLMTTIILILIASSHNSKILLHDLKPPIMKSTIKNDKNSKNNKINGKMSEIFLMRLIQLEVELAWIDYHHSSKVEVNSHMINRIILIM